MTSIPTPIPPGVSLSVESSSLNLTFEDMYQLDERLRSGSYGVVHTCHPKLSAEKTYAVKILDRTKLKKHDDESVFREVAIMRELAGVENVVQLIDFFASPEKLYMVQVFAAGGDVFDRLAQRSLYNEKDSRDLATCLFKTIQALHDRKIVHRDLKPENLLLANKIDDCEILLADFGFARMLPEEGRLTTKCGTPAYVAPEVITGAPYDCKCDLWSIGCLLYMLIGGYPPFQGKSLKDLFRKIRSADFIFHESYWQNASVESKRLISHLLAVNPKTRLSAAEALKSDWFVKSDAESLRSRDLSLNLEAIRAFLPKSKWKVAIHAVRVATAAPFWDPDAVGFKSKLQDLIEDESDNEAPTVASQEGSASSDADKAKPKRTLKFLDLYEPKKKLRKGSYAMVWECIHKETEEVFAVKIIARKGLDPKEDETVLNEVSMMLSLKGNKYVVQLHDFIEEKDAFYLVMENMTGGDVFDRIILMNRYTEKDARDLVVVLLKAVSSMHEIGIAHRDIKPQNLLLKSPQSNADVKVGDFGFARRVHTPESLSTRFGTPSYVAPEILKNIPHDTRVDLWSIGVVTFILLVGYPPFKDNDQSVLFEKIRKGEWKFEEEDWNHISQPAKDFVKGLLVVNPKERWSAKECLRSEWLKQEPETLSQVYLDGSVRNIRDQRHRLQTIAKAIMWLGASTKTTAEIVTQAQDVVLDCTPPAPKT
ncbi:hypothetical protein FisN_7Lh115 [Fistulifera solaris]|uniref:Protein kinase domain-containing protein n=1 Tax=Fistulifera solaris TaxID=1519565 RepID=A0A1Z5JCM0_FISSO|nr:hypothetical protein FisN_7Lh115 [Fistulifera solaris]|eukprot:GAX11735.1 hypothetical protein FisN_7Lh115 [Fistulifera solaris]